MDEEKKEEIKGESELEEALDEVSEEIEEGKENIDDNQFREFLEPTETSAPVLERIQTPIQETGENLEEDIASSSPATTDRRDEVDYATTSNEFVGETNYNTDTGPPILSPVEVSEELATQEFLNPMVDERINLSNDMHPKIVDMKFIEHEMKLPFEIDNKKYKKLEP